MHKTIFSVIVASIFNFISSPSHAAANWLSAETAVAQAKLVQNISVPGTAQGSVIASPSRQDPNYFFYWVRDGSLTMNAVLGLYLRSAEPARSAYLRMLDDFRAFSRANQLTNSPPGLGDPRFNADGTIDYLPWSRPQNDGPALRALTFIRLAQALLTSGRADYVQRYLYAAEVPANSVIKVDLEFVAHNWRTKSFDLWEEIRGRHFFTSAVQQAALIEGAKLAETMGDSGAAIYYRQMAAEIDVELAAHWNASAGYYVATLDSEAGPDHQKPSELDSAIVLAALAAGQSEGTLSPLSDRLLSTASALEHAFAKVYAINADPSTGTAIGRYTEDHYFGGNPWFLTTAAFAELHYRVAEVLQQRTSYYMTAQAQEFFASALPLAYRPMLRPGQDILADRSLASVIIQSLIAKGDRFLDRIRRHGGQDGSLSEQFDRNTGMMLSARDLTWSYASFIQAAAQRDRTTAAFATRR